MLITRTSWQVKFEKLRSLWKKLGPVSSILHPLTLVVAGFTMQWRVLI